MYLLIALVLSVIFFFILDIGLIAKFGGLGFCIFQFVANKNGILNEEGAAQNPLVIQFYFIGSIGAILGVISIGIDLLNQVIA